MRTMRCVLSIVHVDWTPLSGVAKLFIRSQSDVRDWRTLKTALLDAFCASSDGVYRRLKKILQKKNESLHQ